MHYLQKPQLVLPALFVFIFLNPDGILVKEHCATYIGIMVEIECNTNIRKTENSIMIIMH